MIKWERKCGEYFYKDYCIKKHRYQPWNRIKEGWSITKDNTYIEEGIGTLREAKAIVEGSEIRCK